MTEDSISILVGSKYNVSLLHNCRKQFSSVMGFNLNT